MKVMASLADHEKANGTRIFHLLFDKGTEAMRNTFDSIHPPATLTETLNFYRDHLHHLHMKRIINQNRMNALFPPGGVPSKSMDFDITLLFILLRNICDLLPPVSTGLWIANPHASDTSKAADVARIKYYRNKLFSNFSTTRIDDATFNSYWNDISAAVVRLGVSEEEVKKLQCSPLEENLNKKSNKTYDKGLSDKSGKVINWVKSSKKHQPMFENLVKVLKTKPSKATQIGIYKVCLDTTFLIGRGSDGTRVYIGLCADGTEVAVKAIPLDICKELGPNEIEILTASYVKKEQHIVNYRYYTDEVDSLYGYLVLDLCEETLEKYVESKEVDILIADGPKFMREILYGLKALHCGKPAILHRDLKPSNIFINVEGEVVLADFGISRKLAEGQTTHQSSKRGTEGWMAVESLQENLSDKEVRVRYKKQSDIQVAGMLFFFILTKGNHPYGDPMYQMINIMEGRPVNLDKLDDFMAKDLISWMLEHNANDRPSVKDCLKHPYLLSADDRFLLLTRVGNEPEIMSKDITSPVVRQLNADPSLTKPSWKTKIDADVMAFISKKRSYTDDVADLLRFIRNTSEHWHDERPPEEVVNIVGTPKDYFLKLFPTLPLVLHGIIRKNLAWSQRDQLKMFF